MSPQQTIAHYRITTKLGEGGMGEVWRVTDTKLGREVAIKILPAAFGDDPKCVPADRDIMGDSTSLGREKNKRFQQFTQWSTGPGQVFRAVSILRVLPNVHILPSCQAHRSPLRGQEGLLSSRRHILDDAN